MVYIDWMKTLCEAYSILEEYDKLHALPTFKKTQVVRHLADRFHVSDRAVWYVIAGWVKRKRKG